MARRSRMSILKRQRELKKSEKAARKRSKRHGIREPLFQEPKPTVPSGELLGGGSSDDAGEEEDENPSQDEHSAQRSSELEPDPTR